jgi:DNA-binding transcriptional LysR family regulator
MSNQIELRHLKYFLAVAEDLHFRNAADKLFISQPGLSRQIKQMEVDLGVKLFDRHNRKVELTPAGKFLQKEVALQLKSLEEVLSHAKLLESGIDGNLRFGYIGSAMQNIIPSLLMNVRKDFPMLRFDLKEMDNKGQIDALVAQDIDMGFVRMERVPHSLQTQAILEDTFSIVVPKDHFLTIDNFIGLHQLKEEAFILFESSYSQSYYEKVMQLFDESGFSPITSHSSVNASTIFRLVENNFGVAIVPTSLQLGYDMNVRFIELKNYQQRTTLRAIWNKTSRNPVLDNVLNIVRSGFVVTTS